MDRTEQYIQPLAISVVIPTCDRKSRLLSLLDSLNRSFLLPREVLVVDSGDDRLSSSELAVFTNLSIQYLESARSVCIQRNTGIRKASSPWIFLCDDDVEVPPDYLQKLAGHLSRHKEAGAVSGLFLCRENGEWKGSYPVRSTGLLWWKYLFNLGFWGEITCQDNGFLTRRIKRHYQRKGNHIARSGWPVITDFSGDHFITPVYTLGASVIRREWLLTSPFEERLDSHGIGDNYGVSLGFPAEGIHVLTGAFVYHHQEAANRLQRPVQYLRRVLALDYFIQTKRKLRKASRSRLLWSLTGNLLAFILAGEVNMIRPALQSLYIIATDRNPYKKTVWSANK